MKVLVTGGAGYIGCHTVKRLIKEGNHVVVLDNLQTGHIESIKGADFVLGDIANANLVAEVIKKHNIDIVIHFAANSIVSESMRDPARYYNNNVVKAISLLDTMLKNDVNKIVFSSTAAVYGDTATIPIKEDNILAPTNVYGKTKLMIETLIQDYHNAYGLEYMILRYFNSAGADESGEIGEQHNPETHLIPIILQSIKGLGETVYINGADYDTFDGSCIRDYIHVNDLAKAHLLAMKALREGCKSSIYNLGTEKGYSVFQVVETIERITGYKVRKEIVERRKGDPSILIASSEKVYAELGWRAEYSLEDIIRTAWKWHLAKG